MNCGPDSMSWKECAVAVEFLVYVETDTYRLSQTGRADQPSSRLSVQACLARAWAQIRSIRASSLSNPKRTTA
jgi:hypothetical protein